MCHSLRLSALSFLVLAAASTTLWSDDAPSSDAPFHDGWQVRFQPVPELLRLHLPMLQNDYGLLIADVKPNSIAADLGLNAGDILLEANGRPVTSPADLPKMNRKLSAVALQRGRVHTLRPNIKPAYPQIPRGLMPPFGYGPQAGFGGTSVSSYASGNESVSISSVGDRISMEMSIPELADERIRLQGTRQQIERKVRDSSLSPAAKQKVLSTLGGVR